MGFNQANPILASMMPQSQPQLMMMNPAGFLPQQANPAFQYQAPQTSSKMTVAGTQGANFQGYGKGKKAKGKGGHGGQEHLHQPPPMPKPSTSGAGSKQPQAPPPKPPAANLGNRPP